VGNVLFNRIDGRQFRRAVLAVLMISSLLTVVRAVNGH
jgi:hypothetical protein